MTHPDILKMERDGFLGGPPKVIGPCRTCGETIMEGDTYYDDNEGGLFCCLECVLENAGIQERVM